MTCRYCEEPEVQGSGWGLCVAHAQEDDSEDCVCGKSSCGECSEEANAAPRDLS